MIKSILSTENLLFIILTFVITYLVCSINPAIEICKKKTGQDIRKLGSGNAGSANAMRVLGKMLGVVVVILDVVKVAVSYALTLILCKIFLKGSISMEGNIMSAFILAAIIGHCFPIYYGFRGGKGVIVATTLSLLLNYKYSICCIIVCILVYLFTRIPSMATLSGIILYLILIIVMNYKYIIPVSIITVIILFKHRNNIKRIFERQEKIFKM